MPNIAYLDLKYDRRSTVTTLYDDPFTITALTNNCTINISNISDDTDITFKYSIDNGMSYEDVTIEAGDTFSFTISTAGYSVQLIKTESGHWMSNIRIDSDEGDEFSISGNIMTLVDARQTITAVPGYYFFCLFQDAEGLVDASELRLPATEVGASGYAYMFAGCTNLNKGPAILPATTLDNYCYGYMFQGCTSLITTPVLPATTLAEGCYNQMFEGCSSLTTAPALPATTLAESCYKGMFAYSGLSSAPVLPATTLADNCYEEMFIGCSALVTAPALPATTLADYCYRSMFEGCTSLTTAPNLIAENMVKECYKRMFYGCENMNFIRILAKDTATDYITDWVHNVAPFGVFIKDPDTNYTIDSDSGVPIGWTVANEGEDIPGYYYVTLAMEDPELHTTLIGTGRYLAGSTVTISALDINDYIFDGWMSGDRIISYNQTWTFKIHKDLSLKAVFKARSSYVNEYLTIKSLEDNNRIYIYLHYESIDKTLPMIDIKVNDGKWLRCSIPTFIKDTTTNAHIVQINGRTVILNEGDKIQFRRFTLGYDIIFYCGKCNVSGNIACLDPRHNDLSNSTDNYYAGKDLNIMYENETYHNLFSLWHSIYYFADIYDAEGLILPATTLNASCYQEMFKGCTSLVKAPVLPATTLAPHCYEAMFYNCTSLVKAPTLPATTLTDSCYKDMFRDCISLTTAPALPATTLAPHCYESMFSSEYATYQMSLTTAPELPATTLAESCYKGMFIGCTRLATAPELPATTLTESCYSGMFSYCTSLTTVPELPATTLTEFCYSGMFYYCTSLTAAPELPATTLTESCYSGMFYYCTSLTTAPALPATTLADSCYKKMFSWCTSLTTAPALPATTLADSCYSGMFSWCTSLTTAPALPATTLADHCYSSMFYGCSRLTTAPALPATTLADYCYSSMFYACSRLTTAPVLPATTLTDSCYYQMFGSCPSLHTAPALPATILADYCYSRMFWSSGLSSAPVLPATTLADYCYKEMFSICRSLNSITCLATDINATECTKDWLSNVSWTGTFIKAASMNNWPVVGSDGIPSGWTVQDYTS